MNRKLLKNNAKEAFKFNYWRCVLVAFIVSALIGLSCASVSSDSSRHLDALEQHQWMALLIGVLFVLLLSFLIRLLVIRPLYAGCQNFFLKNADEKAQLNEMTSGFKNQYKKTFITLFLTDIFQALWTCLFIVPGIIKAYSYRMVPYILAEKPDSSALEIIKKSEILMKGHKWEAFKLDLSFIGWTLLSILTFGIVGIFWTEPYVLQTDAELYKYITQENYA